MKKKHLFLLIPLLLLCGFLYWSSPGTIGELYPSVNMEQMEWAGGYVRIYEGCGLEQTFLSTRWFPTDSAEFDRFLDMVENTTFRRSITSLLPSPGTRRSPPLQDGMYVAELSFRDSDMEIGFDLQDFYGEVTISLTGDTVREEYISAVNNDSWSAACRELILALGQQQESVTIDLN